MLALRHQLRVLERKVGKPAWQPADRILLAALSQLLPKSGLPSLLPKPETLLRWHRDLVCRKWAAFGQRPRRRRPVRDPERRVLTLKVAEENPSYVNPAIMLTRSLIGAGHAFKGGGLWRSAGISITQVVGQYPDFRLPARSGSHYGKPVELKWAAVDSNHLPPRYQHGALPVELAAQFAGTGPRQASLLCR